MTTSAGITRCDLSTPSLTGWISRRRGSSRVAAEGDGPPGYAPGRSAEALHLRLSEPGAIEPSAGGGMPSQHRGHLAACGRLKPDFKTIADFRRDNRDAFKARVPPVRAAVSPARPVWSRTAGGGRDAHQGGQQQGSQLHARLAGRSSSRPPTSVSTDYLAQGSMKAMSPSRERAARGRRTSRRKSRPCERGAVDTAQFWRSLNARARARFR